MITHLRAPTGVDEQRCTVATDLGGPRPAAPGPGCLRDRLGRVVDHVGELTATEAESPRSALVDGAGRTIIEIPLEDAAWVQRSPRGDRVECGTTGAPIATGRSSRSPPVGAWPQPSRRLTSPPGSKSCPRTPGITTFRRVRHRRSEALRRGRGRYRRASCAHTSRPQRATAPTDPSVAPLIAAPSPSRAQKQPRTGAALAGRLGSW